MSLFVITPHLKKRKFDLISMIISSLPLLPNFPLHVPTLPSCSPGLWHCYYWSPHKPGMGLSMYIQQDWNNVMAHQENYMFRIDLLRQATKTIILQTKGLITTTVLSDLTQPIHIVYCKNFRQYMYLRLPKAWPAFLPTIQDIGLLTKLPARDH